MKSEKLYSKKDREIIRGIRDSFAHEFTVQSYSTASNRVIFVFKHFYLTHHIAITCRGNVLIIYSNKFLHVKKWTGELSEDIAGLNILLEIGSFDYMPHRGFILFSLVVPLHAKPPRTFVSDLVNSSLYALDFFVPEIFARALDLGLIEKISDDEDDNLNYFYR